MLSPSHQAPCPLSVWCPAHSSEDRPHASQGPSPSRVPLTLGSRGGPPPRARACPGQASSPAPRLCGAIWDGPRGSFSHACVGTAPRTEVRRHHPCFTLTQTWGPSEMPRDHQGLGAGPHQVGPPQRPQPPQSNQTAQGSQAGMGV